MPENPCRKWLRGNKLRATLFRRQCNVGPMPFCPHPLQRLRHETFHALWSIQGYKQWRDPESSSPRPLSPSCQTKMLSLKLFAAVVLLATTAAAQSQGSQTGIAGGAPAPDANGKYQIEAEGIRLAEVLSQ